MTPSDVRDAYLMKAKEADEEADKATEGRVKEVWRNIAINYRKLAEGPSPDVPPNSLAT